MAWYTDKDKNGLYEMTIGQDKGVVANSNSAYLCCDVGRVDGIENLYTTGVKDMSYMFSSIGQMHHLRRQYWTWEITLTPLQ